MKKLNKIFRTSLVAAFLLIIVSSTYGQQGNNSYFLNNIPEARFFNPANTGNYKAYVNLPIIPGFNINYSSNPFVMSDFVFPGEGMYVDSLITPFHHSADKEAFLNGLSDKNYLAFEMEMQTFGFGFKVKDMFFSFDMRQKMEAKVGFPKDIFNLIFYGNQHFVGNGADFSYFGLDAIFYHELGFGFSMKLLDDKLSIGVRPKILLGVANINTQNSDFGFTTNALGTSVDFNLNGGAYTNLPLQVHKDALGNIDSLSMPDFNQYTDSEIIAMAIGSGNMGLGIDLGATYQLMDQLTLYASLIDLGSIKWNDDNAQYLTFDGSYQFNGFNLEDLTDTTTNFADNLMEQLKDSLTYDINYGSYSTGIGPKLYLGATWDLTKNINVGFLSRTRFYDDYVTQQFTLSANAQLGHWLAATASYSVMNNSYNNLGLGFAIKGGPWQFYLMTDNIPFYPQHASNVNIRFGWNILISDKSSSVSHDKENTLDGY